MFDNDLIEQMYENEGLKIKKIQKIAKIRNKENFGINCSLSEEGPAQDAFSAKTGPHTK